MSGGEHEQVPEVISPRSPTISAGDWLASTAAAPVGRCARS